MKNKIENNHILIFDFSKSEPLLPVAVTIKIDSLKSIRDAMVHLINIQHDNCNYFHDNNYRIPIQLDFDNLYCHTPSFSQFFYFKLVEILK